MSSRAKASGHFFSTRRTLSCETFSCPFNSTRLPAKSRSVHRLRPLGGSLFASVTRSPFKFSLSLYGIRGRGLGSRAASKPSSTNRCRTRSTVRVPMFNASTICSSVRRRPCALASAISRMRAWFNLRAAVFPTDTNFPNSTRSSSVSVTRYFFSIADLPILRTARQPCLARNRGRRPDSRQPVNLNLTRY